LNNVYAFNTDLEFEAPDLPLIRGSAESMLELGAIAKHAFNSTQYLPSLHTKAGELRTTALKSQKLLNDCYGSLRLDMETRLNRLRKYKAEFDPQASDEDQEDNLYYRGTELKKAVDYASGQHGKAMTILGQLHFIFNPDATDGFLQELQQEEQAYEVSIEKLEEIISTFSEQRQILSDGMKVLESTNFADIAKDTLLTLENVSAMSVTMPEVEMVKMAMDQMKKTLEGVSKTLNYMSMYQERDRIVAKLKSEIEQRDACVTSKRTTKDKIKLINAIHGLYSNFSIIVGELKKVESAVRLFATLIKTGGGQEQQEKTFLDAAPSFIAYLNKAH
jgi:hypothetical protein